MRAMLRVIASMCLLGTLALAAPPAAADAPPPPPPGAIMHRNFEIRSGANQAAMVPIGEGDRTGSHLRVSVSAGALRGVKYHGACGRVILSGPIAERLPTFAPTPTTEGTTGLSAVCGQAGCTCPGAAGMIHIDKPPGSLPGAAIDALEVAGPILPGGGVPEPVAEDIHPGCFGWVELNLDATGLKTGTQILATVEAWVPGAPLSGPPTSRDIYVAAVITP